MRAIRPAILLRVLLAPWNTDARAGTFGNAALVTLLMIASSAGAAAAPFVLQEFSWSEQPFGNPAGVTVGPDGNVWYYAAGKIGKIVSEDRSPSSLYL